MPKVSKKKLDDLIATAGINTIDADKLRQANREDEKGEKPTRGRHGAAHQTPIDLGEL